jgi:RNA polymerase sigma-70 factor, ECF subfamily
VPAGHALEIHRPEGMATGEIGVSVAATLTADSDLETLATRARDGDVRAFEGLYRHLSGRVYGVCLRMAGDAAQAEELAQEAWVRAWERLESFRGESRFSTWLHRLTVNVVLDHRRREGRLNKHFEALPDGALDDAVPAHEAPPGLRMDLDRAVATLPEGARTVFLLYDVEGFKQHEIAERLGVAEGTVKAQLHRARRLLQEVMER